MAMYSYTAPFLFNLEVKESLIQLIVSIFPLSLFLFPPILGKISDSIQNRRIFLRIGALGMIFLMITFLFVRILGLIILLLFLYGFFQSCLNLNFVLYQELIENDRIYISYFNALLVLGWFFGAQIGGLYIDLFGIDSIFQFFLIVSVLNFLIILFIKEDREKITERFQIIGKDLIKSLANDEDTTFDNNIDISHSIYGALFFRNFGIRPIMSILAILMAMNLGLNTEIGFLIGINPLIQFFLMILIGKLVSNGDDNDITILKTLMILGYFLSAFVIFGYILSIDFNGYLVNQILISLSYSFFWTATHFYISQKTDPSNKGKYIGLANSSFYLGSFLGSLFFSTLIGVYSEYYIPMMFMVVFPALSAFLIIIFFRKNQKK